MQVAKKEDAVKRPCHCSNVALPCRQCRDVTLPIAIVPKGDTKAGWLVAGWLVAGWLVAGWLVAGWLWGKDIGFDK